MQLPEPKKPTVHIKTFGCQMNVYDSERMMAVLKKNGYEAQSHLRDADVILLNTCSIRDKAEHKVLSLLGELRPLKEKKPETIIGITGCVGQRMGRKLLQKVPYLDMVLGPDSVDRVGDLVNEVRAGGKRLVDVQFDAPGRQYSQPSLPVGAAKPTEFLTIMKGCDHFCTYCIVPFTRGREKSRPISEIIADVEALVARGTKEITFLGQNINTYGKGTDESLSQLLERANQVEGLARIRYITSHPKDLGQDLIDQFGQLEKLCPALHLPIQSGSDKILKKMSRLYTSADYLKKVEALRRVRPDIALSTDIIVGFPGETDEDFQMTMDVLKTVEFSHGFLFKYSPRPGTKAMALGEEVPESVKEERLRLAQRLVFPQTEVENRRSIGGRVSVLVESVDKKGMHYSGRSLHNKLVHVLNAGHACLGKVIDVDVIDANGSNMKGYYVGAPRTDRGNYERISVSLAQATH